MPLSYLLYISGRYLQYKFIYIIPIIPKNYLLNIFSCYFWGKNECTVGHSRYSIPLIAYFTLKQHQVFTHIVLTLPELLFFKNHMTVFFLAVFQPPHLAGIFVGLKLTSGVFITVATISSILISADFTSWVR